MYKDVASIFSLDEAIPFRSIKPAANPRSRTFSFASFAASTEFLSFKYSWAETEIPARVHCIGIGATAPEIQWAADVVEA